MNLNNSLESNGIDAFSDSPGLQNPDHNLNSLFT